MTLMMLNETKEHCRRVTTLFLAALAALYLPFVRITVRNRWITFRNRWITVEN